MELSTFGFALGLCILVNSPLARETLGTEELYAALCVISALGVSFSFIVRSLARLVTPWQRL